MVWWAWVFAVLIALISLIYATLWSLEERLLLRPARCSTYLNYETRAHTLHPLSSGGLLLHLPPNRGANLGARPILCLHGNAGNIDGMAHLAHMLLESGYDVYLLEYGGYGATKPLKPSPDLLVQDLISAWEHLHHKQEAILFGWSMGGGVIGQFLTKTDSFPAQVVLLNTYFDLPLLVSQVLPVPGVAHLMRTRWNIAPGLKRYCELSLKKNVLVVAAADDELIHFEHAERILESVPDIIERKLVSLPYGGHNRSIDTHVDLWLPHLIPSVLNIK